MQDSKISLWDAAQYLRDFDVILLSETRAVQIPDHLFTDYSLAYCPASEEGRGGEGILVAVRKHRLYHVQDFGSDDSSLWVRLCFNNSRRPLILGAVYIPPAGSSHLQTVDLDARFSKLTARVAAAQMEGDVLLAGDFNARVGHLEESTCARQRGCTDTIINGHGRRLIRLCSETGTLLCTGRLPGDEHASYSYRAIAEDRQSRVDHILVSPDLLSKVQSCHLNEGRKESDHTPLATIVSLPMCLPSEFEQCQGVPIAKRHWSPDNRGLYCEALKSQACLDLLDVVEGALSQDNVSEAVQAIQGVIGKAADLSGMPSRRLGRHSRNAQQQPFFDDQCAALKRQLRRLPSNTDMAARKQLERKYHSVVRTKKRAYQLDRLKLLLRDQRTQPRRFWKSLRTMCSELPVGLQQVQTWDAFLADLCNAGSTAACHIPPDAYPQQPHENAAGLNAPISVQEVLHGLKHLHNGRATGKAGVPSEFLRYAEPERRPGQPPSAHMLAAPLTKVLNSLFRTGTVPDFVNEGLVTPVFKKGEPFDTSNYRPITVTEPLMRLYASILNARLQKFAESNNYRADTQTGFRPGLSTMHQLFALQYFVDEADADKKPLYCCFLDLKGAYDRVQRSLLWQVLERLGVHGSMLQAVKSLYDNSQLCVKVQGRTGQSVPSQTGLKQGCPLSPTLFGLFADGLHRSLAARCPDIGPVLSDGRRVPDLGYADDFVLLAESPQALQALIDATVQFCAATGMLISVDKTKVLVFSQVWPGPFQWLCNGQPLEWVAHFKYLGLVFQAQQGMHATYSHLHRKMWGAWALLQRQYGQLHCASSVGLLLQVYKACVPPTALYGSEIWGPYRLRAPVSSARAALGRSHFQILKQIAGVRSTVATPILLKELEAQPFEDDWWHRAVRFWNELASLPVTTIYKRIALDACQAAVTRNVQNWACYVIKGVRALGYELVISATDMTHIDVPKFTQVLADRMNAVWHDLDFCPRTCPSHKSRLCTYNAWFARLDSSARKSVLSLPLSAKCMRQLLRFRMGCHGLPRDTGSWARIPRADRVCALCGPASLGDEKHLVFECPHLQHIRDQYASLFHCSTMKQFFWQDDIVSVAKFVSEGLKIMLGADSDAQSQASDQP